MLISLQSGEATNQYHDWIPQFAAEKYMRKLQSGELMLKSLNLGKAEKAIWNNSDMKPSIWGIFQPSDYYLKKVFLRILQFAVEDYLRKLLTGN